MKKILLIITIIFVIFQMVVLATAIDIGTAAISRPSTLGVNTLVDQNNPANGTGKITSVEIWATTDLYSCEVATFFVVSGNNLSTRDNEAIPGTVVAGAKRTYSVDLDVQEGDYIGIYYTIGNIESTIVGVGVWYLANDRIPCTDTTFSISGTKTMSLYGTGATEEPPAEGNAIMFGINF